jgi:hypothetical protein
MVLGAWHGRNVCPCGLSGWRLRDSSPRPYTLPLVDRAFRHTWYEENTAEVIARIAKMGLSKPGKKSAARVNGTVSGPLILVSQLSPNARKKR